MSRFLCCTLSVVVGLVLIAPAALAQDKDDPKQKLEKPALGDKDELVIQNKRTLKVRNETAGTLTVFLQFRTLKENAWTWVPANPVSSTEAISFEVEAGMEANVQHEGEPVAASRMRIWAVSPTYKWLRYKSKDAWLVPEKNEAGEHIYTSEALESFTFAFARTKEKDEKPFDETAGERTYPTEGEEISQPPPDISWDDVPPGLPLVRNLSVLPVQVIGSNVLIRIKNLGHFNDNIDRRVLLQRVVPPSFPVDLGPVGPLYHYGVKTFYFVGLTPGSYRVVLSPVDEFPYDGNDERTFAITTTANIDAAVLPVGVVGTKVYLKVKNVGTAMIPPDRHLMVMKWPGGLPVDHGAIGPLAVNGIKAFPSFILPAGTYRAFVSPGDLNPYHVNDAKIFSVAATTHVDLDVLPATVVGGLVTLRVKNIGTAAASPVQHLYVKKMPMGMPVDHGSVGDLGPGVTKVFPSFLLGGGDYRAYLQPGDDPPYHANDHEDFKVLGVMPKPDLEAGGLLKMGTKVKATVVNHGPGKYTGPREWYIEKKVGPTWVVLGHAVIGSINDGAGISIQANFTGPGMYRIRITPGDPHPANDVKTKMLP